MNGVEIAGLVDVIAAFPKVEVVPGRRADDRVALGAFASPKEAADACRLLADPGAYVVVPTADSAGRYWAVPAERYSRPGQLLPGPWNDWTVVS